MRIMKLEAHPEVLVKLAQGKYVNQLPLEALPDDAEILSAHYDQKEKSFVVLVQSKNFDSIHVPTFNVILTERPIKRAEEKLFLGCDRYSDCAIRAVEETRQCRSGAPAPQLQSIPEGKPPVEKYYKNAKRENTGGKE
jgi:hypothetical protein